MATEILMPALSPTMEEGKLVKWHVGEGDPVRAGDVIAEIETDKATMEVEASDEGTLGKILVPEGTADVAVNTPIAVILGEGEEKSAIKAAKPAPQQKAAESAPPAKAQKQQVKTQDTPASKPAKAPEAPTP
jgi:pyruvate dehydrogenase E1 component beta subunit